MGWRCPPFYGNKKSSFYEKKKEKALKKIAKQKAVIAECEKHINVVTIEKA